MHYILLRKSLCGISRMALKYLRRPNLRLFSVIFNALLPLSCLAATSHFSCSEPQKKKSDNLSIDWSDKMLSFQNYESVKASYWSNKIIQWTHPIISKKYKHGRRNLSVQINLPDMTLMYLILDSRPVSPDSNQEWAMFLPVYMQCREFF